MRSAVSVIGKMRWKKPKSMHGIGEHRPGERRRGREDQRALDHEDDRQEQREQAGDADDDALVERQPVDLLLVGVRLPEIELRQVRRCAARRRR